MKRVSKFNALFVSIFVVVSSVYPVFWSVLYNFSGGIDVFPLDLSSIIEDRFDTEDANFISADLPLYSEHNWNNRKEVIYYTIQENDTLSGLAKDFGIAEDTIRRANTILTFPLQAGKELVISPGDWYVYISQEGETLEGIARKYKISPIELSKNNSFLPDFLRTWTSVYLPYTLVPIHTYSENKILPSKSDIWDAFYHDLQLINPTGKWFALGHCTYFVAKYWDVQWRGHAKDWYNNANKAGYQTGPIAKAGAIAVWYGPGYNLSYGHVGIVMSVNQAAWTMVVQDMNYTGLWHITTRIEKIQNQYLIGFIYNQQF